jgi:hypothetical protein
MTQTDVDVTAVPSEVIDAVGNDYASGPTGKVVIERLERLLRPYTTFAKELPEMLFRLRIQGKHRVACCNVFGLQFGDPLELGGEWSSSSAIRLSPSQIRACGLPALGSSQR